MKIFKFIASFLLILGILLLMIWAMVRTNDQTCTGISIVINSSGEPKLVIESDVLNVLAQNNVEWEGKKIKEIDMSFIKEKLAQENYVKSIEKVHFLNSKLQIEISLHNILLAVVSNDDKKFLLDEEGVYLPYSPKIENDVIITTGFIPNHYKKYETVTSEDKVLYGLFYVASLIRADSFYANWFNKMELNNKQEIILYPDTENLPVLFGTAQDAEKKLKILKHIYYEVLPYIDEGTYAQLDVRFQNRIIATKSKS
jgi:hypothetical protein